MTAMTIEPTGTERTGTEATNPHPAGMHPTATPRTATQHMAVGAAGPTPTTPVPTAAGITGEQSGPIGSPGPTRRINLAGLVIGLFCLVVGVLVIAREQFQWKVDWQLHGPVVLIGAGILLVALGALGLIRRDRRRGTVSHPLR